MTKPAKWPLRPVKTRISLGIFPVWSKSSLSAWRDLGSLATHGAHREDSDHPGHPRLIRLGWCPGWSESLLGTHSFCLFCHVMAHLSFHFPLLYCLSQFIITVCTVSLSLMSQCMTKWPVCLAKTDHPAQPDLSLCCALYGWLSTQIVKTDQTGWMPRLPRLIWVFAGRTDHFVGFVMLWLKFVFSCMKHIPFLSFCVCSFILLFHFFNGIEWSKWRMKACLLFVLK